MKIRVLTGAGISAESGLQTFRGTDGLWEGQNVHDVATPDAWKTNPERVLKFYNMRRDRVREAEPNAAHLALARLQECHDVRIVTQNIDDLHERAGSRQVLHLHGEIMKAQSSVDPSLVYDLKDKSIAIGDKCEQGSQLRPHVVWFGEPVRAITEAASIISDADLLLVIGTSLSVYPAAGLVEYAPSAVRIIIINPEIPEIVVDQHVEAVHATACQAVPAIVEKLCNPD